MMLQVATPTIPLYIKKEKYSCTVVTTWFSSAFFFVNGHEFC